MPPEISPEIIAQMREWLKDLDWGNAEPEDIDSAPDKAIINNVERFYAGGVEKFVSESTAHKESDAYTAPEPPSFGVDYNQDPFVLRDPQNPDNGSDGPRGPEDALDKERPKGMPSKVSWFIGKSDGK